MCTFSVKQLASIKGVSERTFYKYLSELRTKKKFTKKSHGKGFGETDAHRLAKLLDFQSSLNNYLIIENERQIQIRNEIMI